MVYQLHAVQNHQIRLPYTLICVRDVIVCPPLAPFNYFRRSPGAVQLDSSVAAAARSWLGRQCMHGGGGGRVTGGFHIF